MPHESPHLQFNGTGCIWWCKPNKLPLCCLVLNITTDCNRLKTSLDSGCLAGKWKAHKCNPMIVKQQLLIMLCNCHYIRQCYRQIECVFHKKGKQFCRWQSSFCLAKVQHTCGCEGGCGLWFGGGRCVILTAEKYEIGGWGKKRWGRWDEREREISKGQIWVETSSEYNQPSIIA